MMAATTYQNLRSRGLKSSEVTIRTWVKLCQGTSQRPTAPDSRPTHAGNTVKRIGEDYHIASRMHLAEIDAKHRPAVAYHDRY